MTSLPSCRLLNAPIYGSCGVKTCMNNVRGKCVENELSELSFKENRKYQISKILDTEESEIDAAVLRIQAGVVLNKFFHYLFRTSVLHCTESQIQIFLESKPKYKEWVSRIPKPPFEILVGLLNKIKSHL